MAFVRRNPITNITSFATTSTSLSPATPTTFTTATITTTSTELLTLAGSYGSGNYSGNYGGDGSGNYSGDNGDDGINNRSGNKCNGRQQKHGNGSRSGNDRNTQLVIEIERGSRSRPAYCHGHSPDTV